MTICIKPTLKQIGAHSKTKLKWFQGCQKNIFFFFLAGNKKPEGIEEKFSGECKALRDPFQLCGH